MKHPKDSPMARPTTAPESIWLTPSEIESLREHHRELDVKIRAELAAERARRAAAAAEEQQKEELLQAFELAAQQRLGQ
jgi:hypothetical protein